MKARHNGSKSHQMAGFHISSVEPSGSITTRSLLIMKLAVSETVRYLVTQSG